MTVYAEIREKVSALVKEKNCGPILIRLSWHDAGTFCSKSRTGGPHACMRMTDSGESTHGANNGLQIAIGLLAGIKAEYPEVSHSDFWALAANAAIEAMGGPHVPFRPGRVDAKSSAESAPEGRLPDATKGADHVRDIFYRMGFGDREIVALSGAHTVGACHPERSGFEGPWTTQRYVFDNEYFKDLLEMKWASKVNSAGNTQFEDQEGKGLMMLSTDLALVQDEEFKKYVQLYADDKQVFFEDFKNAFQKLQELGCNNLAEAV